MVISPKIFQQSLGFEISLKSWVLVHFREVDCLPERLFMSKTPALFPSAIEYKIFSSLPPVSLALTVKMVVPIRLFSGMDAEYEELMNFTVEADAGASPTIISSIPSGKDLRSH